MNHAVYGRKLNRNTNERRRLFMNLARDMFTRGSVKTSEAKAKAVRPLIEKLITKAKKDTQASYRNVLAVLDDRTSVKRLMEDAKTRFSGRNSGYTRIVKLGKRQGDATDMVLLTFVDQIAETETVAVPETKTETKAEVKKETVKETKTKRTPRAPKKEAKKAK